MKKFLKFSLVLVVAVFTFSCSNDNTDVIPEDPQSNSEANATLKANFTSYARTAFASDQAESILNTANENSGEIDECFTLNFPYSLTNNNDVVTVNDEAEAQNFINAGYYLVFPVDATLADGTQTTINNEFELIQIIQDCLGDVAVVSGNDCFQFVFPLGVVTADGNVVTVNDYLELFSIENAVGFDYPIGVSMGTATVVITIHSDEEFDELYNECYDIDPCDDCGVNCFEIVYPITLVQDDGTITTVNNDEEFITFLDGLDEDDYFVPTYPMNIEYEDGTQATINNDIELTAAFDACDD